MPRENLIRSGALAFLLSGCAITSILLPRPGGQSEINNTAIAEVHIDHEATKPHALELTRGDVKPHANIWLQLASEFTWNNPANPAISAALELINQQPQAFERATARAAPYLWYIVDQLQKRTLPPELALVPLIESGYQALAQSPGGAAGLWQFMPATGRRFGLKQTRWYDGRRDIVASTQAALDYFEHLNQRFDGDWLLAVAAYNCGPAKVRRALKQNNATDYWAIAADLPPETRRHIPKLLASIQIVRDPTPYQIALPPIPDAPAFTQFDLADPIALEYLFYIKGWSKAAFEKLNPAFKQRYTGPQGPFEILVPIGLEQRVSDVLARIPLDQRIPTQIHIVETGDTLSEIAQKYGVAIYDLKTNNNLRGNLLKVGKELVVPMSRQTDGENEYDRPAIAEGGHVVKRGDSLWTIGQKYGTSPKAIAKLNNISLSATIQPGRVLLVHGPQNAARYAVVRGDSLWRIARKFRISVNQLQTWNNFSRHRVLQPGETVIVSNPRTNKQHEI